MRSTLERSLTRWVFTTALVCCLILIGFNTPAWASPDAYVDKYLDAAEPVALNFNQQGDSRLFSADDLSEGKQLFEENCINCHVGGSTLPDPTVSLSLDALHGASPPRDNISNLVQYLRLPMTYDGSEETYWCRQVPESWMSDSEVENLSAFILRAAQKAPGWGTSKF
ncbi:MAG: photosystem II cytochrome PsbV2 [Elainellaceae cyanobacterium]